MTVAETSLEAYHSLEYKETATMRMKVFSMISLALHPSNKDIARLMNVEINRVTPRVNELVKDGLVECGGIKIDAFTKKRCKWWKVVDGVE